jgi:hypothetical protein
MADTPTMLLAAAAAVALAALATDAAGGAEPSPPVTIGVDRTAFAVRLPDGTVLAQEELAGAVLDARDEAGLPLTVRIDGFARDPKDLDGEVVLYQMTTPDGRGGWQEACGPDPAG